MTLNLLYSWRWPWNSGLATIISWMLGLGIKAHTNMSSLALSAGDGIALVHLTSILPSEFLPLTECSVTCIMYISLYRVHVCRIVVSTDVQEYYKITSLFLWEIWFDVLFCAWHVIDNQTKDLCYHKINLDPPLPIYVISYDGYCQCRVIIMCLH